MDVHSCMSLELRKIGFGLNVVVVVQPPGETKKKRP